MLDNPWNAPIRPNADDPSPRVVSLHRGPLAHISATRVARATRDPGMLAALAERAEEIAYDDFYVRGGMTRLGQPARHLIVRDLPRLTIGERLVLFFRLNGEALTFWFAMASIGLLFAAVVGAWMGVGR